MTKLIHRFPKMVGGGSFRQSFFLPSGENVVVEFSGGVGCVEDDLACVLVSEYSSMLAVLEHVPDSKLKCQEEPEIQTPEIGSEFVDIDPVRDEDIGFSESDFVDDVIGSILQQDAEPVAEDPDEEIIDAFIEGLVGEDSSSDEQAIDDEMILDGIRRPRGRPKKKK